MAEIEVENIVKTFVSGSEEEVVAVDNLSFSVEQGELFTLLGPSGCGKTTTLRCIAGLETINQGTIRLQGDTVSDPSQQMSVAPNKRNIGLMYQSYALWPHMTVRENIVYALNGRNYAGDNDDRVAEVLELVGMPEVGDRYPSELSGGQQQRVAFARALSYDPAILLMDEPLSNLDLKQRRRMRTRLLEILDQVGTTTLYVTHDQEEAFEISDNIAVLNGGRKIQEGSPEQLYQQPASSFVAGFLGEANIFNIHITNIDSTNEILNCEISAGNSTITVNSRHPTNDPPRDPVMVIRPEDITLNDKSTTSETHDGLDDANLFRGEVVQRRFRGHITLNLVDIHGIRLKVTTEKPLYDKGEMVDVYLPPQVLSIIDT